MGETEKVDHSSLIHQALFAFRMDSNYAISMMRQAMNITKKRETWQVRLELRDADRAARKACSEQTFVCKVRTPCGTGDCRFSVGDMVEIEKVAFKEAKTDKPQGGYACDPDAAVDALRRIRAEA